MDVNFWWGTLVGAIVCVPVSILANRLTGGFPARLKRVAQNWRHRRRTRDLKLYRRVEQLRDPFKLSAWSIRTLMLAVMSLTVSLGAIVIGAAFVHTASSVIPYLGLSSR